MKIRVEEFFKIGNILQDIHGGGLLQSLLRLDFIAKLIEMKYPWIKDMFALNYALDNNQYVYLAKAIRNPLST